MTSALLSDDQELPTLDSFWYMTSQMRDSDYIADENPVYGQRCNSIRING